MRCVGKSKARLEVPKPPVVGVVESTIIAIKRALTRQFDLAAERGKVHLSVADFHPRRISLIPKPEVQGKRVGDSPVILKVGAKDIGTLSPCAPIASASQRFGKPQKEVGIRRPRASPGYSKGVGARRPPAVEKQDPRHARVTCEKGVNSLSPVLETGMQNMPTPVNDQAIF